MSETWFFFTSPPGKAAWNMAVDELLLQRVSVLGSPVLRFYSWSEPAATFGYFQRFREIEAWTDLRPLIRRPTGGGLVRHDADWTYSLAFPPGHWWHGLKAAESYYALHDWLRRSFARLGVETHLAACCQKDAPGQCFVGAEKSDLLWQGRKIAGAAQRRTRDGLLVQGSVQNLSSAVTRGEWEHTMLETAPMENRAVQWTPLAFGTGERIQSETLAAKQYALPAYNQKR